MNRAYYIRFELATDYLNLLYHPHAGFEGEDVNRSLAHLFHQFADPAGTISYFDPDEHCIVTLRSQDLDGLRIYLYDESAPYEGYYLDGRFIEALEVS